MTTAAQITHIYRKCRNIFVFVAVAFVGGSSVTGKSSTFRESCVIINGRCSSLSSVVVMATRTCQPLLRHRRSSQLAAGSR